MAVTFTMREQKQGLLLGSGIAGTLCEKPSQTEAEIVGRKARALDFVLNDWEKLGCDEQRRKEVRLTF